ncbi:MAG: 2Fe-2S iron-sulfur cluster-binding protein, partial [Carboxylicivirga sp.]|nr:2Fe-2S iron-sulfur cluster-binding protein [Carboxylicivirga sp.]
MSDKINLKIDNIAVSIHSGATILEAASKVNIRIPTLCYHEDLCVAGNCR